ncbi:MAG TPA: J domain-containing protein [Verrucomicrobiae bacterium]|nr:J domain-containing protein [Verrucomicrobiae bacterium]
MNEFPEGIARWLERERRTDRASAAVLSIMAIGSGVAVFLLMTFLVYGLLSVVFGAAVGSGAAPALVAVGLTTAFFARSMKSRQRQLDLVLDPMGFWIIKDIFAFGPRCALEGFRQLRRCEELGQLNVRGCARALAYLAGQDRSVTWEELVGHCARVSTERLREQLSLLDGVLFLGADASRVILMEPVRLRLRAMLGPEDRADKGPEPGRPKFDSAERTAPVLEPENLSPYELLGVSPSASMMQIKAAYRKRVKTCHPDLLSGMDEQAKALAERWTRALNAAYATLNPRHRGTRANSTRRSPG